MPVLYGDGMRLKTSRINPNLYSCCEAESVNFADRVGNLWIVVTLRDLSSGASEVLTIYEGAGAAIVKKLPRLCPFARPLGAAPGVRFKNLSTHREVGLGFEYEIRISDGSRR